MRHLTFTFQVWGEVYIGLLVCGKIDLKSYTKCVTISFQHRFDCFVHDGAIQNFIRRNFRSDTHFEDEENGSLIDENNCHQNHEVTYKMDQEKLVVGDL